MMSKRSRPVEVPEGTAEAEETRAGEPRILCALSDPGPGIAARLVNGIEAIRGEIEAGRTVWIDVEQPTYAEIEAIQSLFPFHPLAIEDIHHAVQRPKIDEYDDHLFVVAFAIRGAESGTGFDAVEVDIFLGVNYLVTVHERPVAALSEVWNRCLRGRVAMERGPDLMLHAVLDAMVDSYFPLLDRFDEVIEGVEEQVLDHADPALLPRIFSTRKDLLAYRRLLGPHRDMAGHLAAREYSYVSPGVRLYFRDVNDHLLRMIETVDSYRELVDTAVETYLTQTAERTNRVMKILTVIATLGLPLTVLTGFFGMNFDHLPGLHDRGGIWLFLGLTVVTEAVLLQIFRRKGWI